MNVGERWYEVGDGSDVKEEEVRRQEWVRRVKQKVKNRLE